MKPRTTCRDCNVSLTPITLRDAGDHNYPVPARYELPEAKPSWFGIKPDAGTLHGFMCPECGLVQIYAEPKPPKPSKG